ncbi:amino acid adenylation domain-containing protein [Fulvivirgaceae bacterium BMA10]|uniref:Amino acid adenylation domain-containing protein n=1 Tax=Splendidivirga corallicola TaxID=3051826 RepID=A0ABT8KXD5_9BACT|nr:amino acid adenylation domain-containing protein [Fulvivirgaceae bacterium BMA10]
MDYLLQDLLIESAEKYPEKDAVVFGEEKVSYAELDLLTNKVANVLIGQGIKRGDRVGIYINKSIPSIISVYGILKAGAVYVPLDPQAPPSRISYIIDNCDINCILTSTAKLEAIGHVKEEAKSLEIAIFTDDKKEINEELPLKSVSWQEVLSHDVVHLPESQSINNDLAYIIYTSGSTGTPKGVMISHLNSLTFVNWVVENLKVRSEDRFSSHAPLHFDLSILDIYACAKVGGTLCLVPETLSMFPSRLSSWIESNRISVWYSVPSILSMMVTHGQLDQRDLSNMRLLIFAGEVFPIKYLRQLMQLVPGPEYVNLYGPTETNVVTYYITPSIPETQTKPIPIGKRCENVEVFALTKDGKVVTEPGDEGELVARGTCVAQGYWGDEEKTNKVFINNPVQPNFKDRIYKTGDLVTLDEEGNYLYMGRVDHMIKSRGYRIEIGEIESVLYEHQLIEEVAVIAVPDDLITNRIKAIIALKTGEEISSSDLRMFCSEKLPKYMIPEVIEFRENLPKTSTGKVDKPTLLKESV